MRPVLRSSKIYKNIEKFKDYELTQSIAYEMAARNQEAVGMSKERDKYDLKYEMIEECSDEILNAESREDIEKIKADFLQKDPKRKEMAKKQKEIDSHLREKFFFKDILPIEPAKFLSDEEMLMTDFYLHESVEEQMKKTLVVDYEKIKNSLGTNGIAPTKAGGEIDYKIVFPAFSKPLPDIPANLSKEIDLHINLALPLEEIIAYVKTIKDAYDKSGGTVFRTPSVLDDNIEIDKNISSIHIKTKKKNSKLNISIPDKKKQEVYADLFFIYDTLYVSDIEKQGDKIQHIKSEMIDYYAAKVARYNNIRDIDDISYEIGTPRDQSIREYGKIMKHYIADCGYKSLLV